MLNWKSQRLDLQEGRLTEQTIDVDTQGMCSEFGVEASAQAPEGMGIIDFNVKLIGELRVHCFNHLTNRVVKTLDRARQALLLIAARNGFEVNSILLPYLSGFCGTEIGFIAQHL